MGIWEESTPVETKKEEATFEVPNQDTTGEVVEVVEEGFKGLPVRTEGDRIWLLKDGKRFWVTSKEIYESLGFKFGDERKIDEATLMCLAEGEPLRA
jgi:hypothetical protein